jgi:hypothetical protein
VAELSAKAGWDTFPDDVGDDVGADAGADANVGAPMEAAATLGPNAGVADAVTKVAVNTRPRVAARAAGTATRICRGCRAPRRMGSSTKWALSPAKTTVTAVRVKNKG